MEENNIVYDSYYLINLFKEAGKKVTQLQVQKIMYFFEAYYMCEHDNIPYLYKCNFNAWMFGPVAIPLHKEYKSFEGRPIVITEEQEKIGNQISEEKKRILDYIFKVFGNKSPKQLVNLTHMIGSPWHKKWIENEKRVVYGEASYIDKIETRDWFRKNFLNEGNN